MGIMSAVADAFPLTTEELEEIRRRLGREPTRLESFIFSALFSEHCSYKSSRAHLKKLPSQAAHVLVGPGEDAGVVALPGTDLALVMAHESHNHPSQVLPMEGAATGVGGIVRDVNCMGATVIAIADALRFGDPYGPNAHLVRQIIFGVREGIWRYGNAIGVPNLAGDVAYDASFDGNCLVNVVALGLVRQDGIVHSRVPAQAKKEPYGLFLIGKPSDYSGFMGAAFASETLSGGDQRSAVQIPDPFVKNVLLRANEALFEAFPAEKLGMKDLGAAGLAGSLIELLGADFGAVVDLDLVPTSFSGMEAEALLLSETQERYLLAAPLCEKEEILKLYNEAFDLPRLYPGCGATLIGQVTSEPTLVGRYRGVDVLRANTAYFHDPPQVARPVATPARFPAGARPSSLPEPRELHRVLLSLLAHPNAADPAFIVATYDQHVQGRTVLAPMEGDAGLYLADEKTGLCVALAVDGNPLYGGVSPYWAGAHAVYEAMRNCVSVGAAPLALSDCLNFGNPEIPEAMGAFVQAVEGLRDAAFYLHPGREEPTPFITGNVSFYNGTEQGQIKPSPIVACAGAVPLSRVVTPGLKKEQNLLLLTGPRREELGGSLYAALYGRHEELPLPVFLFAEENLRMELVLRAQGEGWVESCHDVSAGGLLPALVEMALLSPEGLGFCLELDYLPTLPLHAQLFSESPGFVLEVARAEEPRVRELFAKQGVDLTRIGFVQRAPFCQVRRGGHLLLSPAREEVTAARKNLARELGSPL